MQEAGFARYPQLEPNSKSMMKMKLTLFVAVIAVALFGVGCASTETSSDPLENGLVAYYPFNGNSLDESGNGIHGGVNGATLCSDRHNKPKSAYSFNGRSWVELPKNKILKFGAGDFSYCAWINTSLVDLKGRVTATIIAEDSNARPHRFLALDYRGRLFFGVRDSDFPSDKILTDNGESIADSKWHQIVGIRKGAHFKIAVDGNIVKVTENVKVGSSDEEIPVGIGARMDSASKNTFKGSIDDVRIYNRALSAEEVKALYDLEKPKGK
jgi:hypothetical protein